MACVCLCMADAKSKSVWIVLNQKIFIAFCRHQFRSFRVCMCVCVCARASVRSTYSRENYSGDCGGRAEWAGKGGTDSSGLQMSERQATNGIIIRVCGVIVERRGQQSGQHTHKHVSVTTFANRRGNSKISRAWLDEQLAAVRVYTTKKEKPKVSRHTERVPSIPFSTPLNS